MQNKFSNVQKKSKPKTIFRLPFNGDNPIANIEKSSLKDARLSLKAKGLHQYMLLMPDDWVFYRNELCTHCKDGRDAIRSALWELVDAGYVDCMTIRSSDGRLFWETKVFESRELNPNYDIARNCLIEKRNEG